MNETVTPSPIDEQEPAVRLGAVLRGKRIAMGLSVADVAAQIRLAPRQIEALEADDLGHLPELPFVRGFVRSYAKLLQLDDKPLLATLPDPHAATERIEPESVEVPFNIQQLSGRQNRLWLYASAAVALLASVFLAWHYVTPKVAERAPVAELTESAIILPVINESESAVPASAVMEEVEAASPVLAVSAPVVAAPLLKSATVLAQSAVPSSTEPPTSKVAPTKLRIVFAADSWTEVRDATGRLMSSKMNESGTELNLNGQAPYELIIGHARSVQLYRRGKLVDLTKYINATSEVARLTLE